MFRRLSPAVLSLLPLTGLGGTLGPAPTPAAMAVEAGWTSGITIPQPPALPVLPSAVDPWVKQIEQRLSALEGRDALKDTSAKDSGPAKALQTIARSVRGRTRVGISVRDLQTGALLFDHHGERPLNPASNQKLLTATAAVELLGADYRFETTFSRDDEILYVRGGGDPSLQMEDIESIAAALASQLDGIEQIVVDESFFSAARFGPGYDATGPGHAYQAPSGPLSLQFNTVMVTARPGSAGEPLHVSTFPECDHVLIDSTANTVGGRGLSIDTRRRGDHTVVVVRGGLRAGHAPVRIRRRIHDPGQFAGTTLATALARRTGGDPLPVVRGSAPPNARPLHTHRSAPLREVLTSALKWSNNFTIEQVLRTLGRHATGQPGDWDNGSDVLLRFWNALGQDEGTLAFENASGLSRTGRVAPRALVDMMALWRDGEGSQVVDALPVAGREGTLRGRLFRTRGRVRAKTGTLKGASALSGIVTDKHGEPQVAFSVLVNGPIGAKRARRLQDRVVYALLRNQS